MFKITYKKLLTFLTLIGCLVWLAVWQFPDQKLKVIFCDVGQGDATLIVQGFNQILIDGGPNDKVLTCLKNNMPFWDKKIEIVALTHPESDHMTGIIPVLEKYEVEYFLSGPEGNESAGYLELISRINVGVVRAQPANQTGIARNAPTMKIINPYSGDKIKLGSITLNTIWPSREFVVENIDSSVIASETKQSRLGLPRGKAPRNDAVLGAKTTHSKLNDFSLVFLLTYTDKKIMLMGDADQAVQGRITLLRPAWRDFPLRPSDFEGRVGGQAGIDILKYPHHGSKTGMTKSFLEQINPKETVISVGKNSYGHPTSEALEMLKLFNVLIRRTDLEGEIKYTF